MLAQVPAPTYSGDRIEGTLENILAVADLLGHYEMAELSWGILFMQIDMS